jgi:CBS-domain-containing membrane protein
MKPIGTLLKTAHGQFWSVSPEDTVFNALQLLAQHEVGALMVMQDGKLVGVVSERDYTARWRYRARAPRKRQWPAS